MEAYSAKPDRRGEKNSKTVQFKTKKGSSLNSFTLTLIKQNIILSIFQVGFFSFFVHEKHPNYH